MRTAFITHAVFYLLLAPLFAEQQQLALDPLLKNTQLWQIQREDFIDQYGELGFGWNSAAEDVAQTTQPDLKLFGLPVYQALARFGDGRLQNITVSFYNRGDAGELRREQFDELVRRSVEGISAFTGKKFSERGKDAGSAVKAFGLEWNSDTSRYLLEYSFTREVKSRDIPYRAEFVRLEIAPRKEEAGLLSGLTASEAVEKAPDPSKVKREDSGDVFIDSVPMVDQGEKGYCVVASVERVMRYYGNDVDEHELAQIANSSAAEGTSIQAMVDSLKKLTARLRIKTRVIESLDVRSLLDTINDYNRLARRGKRAAEIDTGGAVLDLRIIYAQMKPEILSEVRTKNKSAVSRFQRTIASNINEGVPLLWSVMLGVVPEPNIPQGAGGHMRLIIGYNEKSGEVLYSDSWGRGHELKRMAFDDAWTITTGLNTIEPI
jgi:hypothetical protein